MNDWTKIISTLAATAFLAGASHGQDENGSDAIDALTPFNVIGNKSDILSLQGSGTVLDASDLGPYFHTDVTEILRQVPGVYIRPEEGYGLFPNISLRGVDPNRSSKVTIMEDGIPSSPSPFSDPAAYYSPTAGRMSGFEILKGSSQLRFGPNTTGGVINYLSTPVPQERASHWRMSYGEHNERIGHANSGGKTALGGGTLGYLVEVFDHHTDGWKTVNGLGSLPSTKAPVAKTDLMLKLGYEFGDENYLEFKAGRTDLDGDVSYVGLSREDFLTNPYQRYVGTAQDNMDSDHTRYYLRFRKEFTPDVGLTATAFYNEFNRDWYKVADVTPSAGAKIKVGKGVTTSLAHLAVLKGAAAGNYSVNHNDRSYEVKGIQANVDYKVGWHDFDVGFRYTEDVYTNNPYTTDTYDVIAGTSIARSATTSPSSLYDRRSEALELFFTDEITLGALTITPGVRYTDVDYEYKGSNARSLDDVIVGLGAGYEMTEALSFFGGIHQGHSFPGAEGGSSEASKGLRGIEESLGFEVGFRGFAADLVAFELAYFHNTFDNMIASASLATGVEDSANIGDASVHGVEVVIGSDLGRDLSFAIPVSVSVTYTKSEFDAVAGSGTGYWAGATPGNELPYIPDFQYNLRGGLELDKVSAYFNYHWTAAVYSDGSNTPAEKLSDYGVLDFSAFYALTEGVQLFGKVTNFADKKYVASFMPDGYRPGAPRVASIGMSFDF